MRTVPTIAVLVLACGLGLSQSTAPAVPPGGRPDRMQTGDPQFDRQRNENLPTEQRMEREREKRVNRERQATLRRDTDKLLALATELKRSVDKTNENILSVDVIRKAEEIEKLAHSIRQKMKSD